MNQFFIKVRTVLPNAPSTNKLMAQLGCSKCEAIGVLVSLYSWAFQFAQDGDLSKYASEEIASACNWKGKTSKLVRALNASACMENGKIADWDFIGEYFKTLERDRLRKAEKRKQENESPTEIQWNSSGNPSVEEEENEKRTKEDLDSDSEKKHTDRERVKERRREGERGRDEEGERERERDSHVEVHRQESEAVAEHKIKRDRNWFEFLCKYIPNSDGQMDNPRAWEAWDKLTIEEKNLVMESTAYLKEYLKATGVKEENVPSVCVYLETAYWKRVLSVKQARR